MNANFPPDARYGLNANIGTSGQPAENAGSEGDLATDPETGDLYIKTTEGWKFIATGTEV
jgi:hypothetical protein